jgi:SPP1 family predicted phage head-tail adaptor
MYDRPINIEKRTKQRNAVGTPISVWAPLKSLFAHVSYRGGNTSMQQFGAQTRTDATFSIRFDPAIDYDCRIQYGNQYYRIRHIEIMGRDENMRLQCIMFEEQE